MQVYKTFFKVLRKYRTGIMMYTVITIIMLSLLTASNSQSSKDVTLKQYTLLVVDQDNSQISQNLVNYLDEVHNLQEGTYTDDQIKDMLYYQSISEYIVIPKGFGDSISDLVADIKSGKKIEDANPSTLLDVTYDDALPRGIFINMQINQYLNSVATYMANGKSLDYASSKTREAIDPNSFVTMQESDVQTSEKSYTAFLFLPFGLISIIFSGVLPVIISFNEKEKKNRTIISSIPMTSRNMALVLASASLACIVTLILVGFATFADNGRFIFTESWWLALVNAFVYTITITLLLSMITSLPLGIGKTTSGNTTAFITNIIGLSFAFLGGTFVDLTILGDKVAVIGRFIPNYWYSIASRKIWYEDASLMDVLPSFGLQLLFGFVCLSIGLVFTRFFGERGETN